MASFQIMTSNRQEQVSNPALKYTTPAVEAMETEESHAARTRAARKLISGAFRPTDHHLVPVALLSPATPTLAPAGKTRQMHTEQEPVDGCRHGDGWHPVSKQEGFWNTEPGRQRRALSAEKTVRGRLVMFAGYEGRIQVSRTYVMPATDTKGGIMGLLSTSDYASMPSARLVPQPPFHPRSQNTAPAQGNTSTTAGQANIGVTRPLDLSLTQGSQHEASCFSDGTQTERLPSQPRLPLAGPEQRANPMSREKQEQRRPQDLAGPDAQLVRYSHV